MPGPDEIDRLRDLNNDLMANCNHLRKRAQDAEAEVEKLRSDNEALLDALIGGGANIIINSKALADRIQLLEDALVSAVALNLWIGDEEGKKEFLEKFVEKLDETAYKANSR